VRRFQIFCRLQPLILPRMIDAGNDITRVNKILNSS
jgi:hypothetical protein